jgi:O-antigen/teichoic acid export membrane protein
MSADSPSLMQAPLAQTQDPSRLDRHLVHGIAWTAAAKWITQVLAWASMIIVARLLLPRDFGIVGMAALYLGLIQTFSEFGFGSAIVTLRDLKADEIAQINSVAVISGVAGFVLACVVAVPLGRFFHEPRLPAVVVVMSASFLIAAFKTVPAALLQRDMGFKKLSLADTLQALSQALSTLALAWIGLGYWALVLGNIVAVIAGTTTCVAFRRFGFRRPRFVSIKHAVRFSSQLLIGRFCWYGYSNADFLVAGRVLGPAPLGFYTLGWNLANMPVEKVTALVGQVTPTFFSAVQKDPALLRRYLRNLTEGIALITFPASLGLALVAPELVHTLLGAKWGPAVPALQVLAAYASLRSICTLLPQVLYVVGESRFAMWNGIEAVILMPILFVIGSHWGTRGVAMGWVVGYPIIVAPLFWRTFRRIQMSVREYFAAIRAPLGASMLMAVAVLVLRHVLLLRFSQRALLAAEVLAGAVTYAAILWLFHRRRLQALYATIRGAREA